MITSHFGPNDRRLPIIQYWDNFPQHWPHRRLPSNRIWCWSKRSVYNQHSTRLFKMSRHFRSLRRLPWNHIWWWSKRSAHNQHSTRLFKICRHFCSLRRLPWNRIWWSSKRSVHNQHSTRLFKSWETFPRFFETASRGHSKKSQSWSTSKATCYPTGHHKSNKKAYYRSHWSTQRTKITNFESMSNSKSFVLFLRHSVSADRISPNDKVVRKIWSSKTAKHYNHSTIGKLLQKMILSFATKTLPLNDLRSQYFEWTDQQNRCFQSNKQTREGYWWFSLTRRTYSVLRFKEAIISWAQLIRHRMRSFGNRFYCQTTETVPNWVQIHSMNRSQTLAVPRCARWRYTEKCIS